MNESGEVTLAASPALALIFQVRSGLASGSLALF